MKKARGFTLLELLMVVALSSAIAIVSFQDKLLETEQAQARQLGMELYQYNNAVQNFLASSSGGTNPAALHGKNFKGVDWLKASAVGCTAGTASQDWLPCRFLADTNGKTTFGKLSFDTTISYSAQTGLSARTFLTPLQFKRGSTTQRRGDLSGLAVLVASGASTVSGTPVASGQDGSILYCTEIGTRSPQMAANCGSNNGSIVMFTRNFAPAERWLRVDHGNVMGSTLEFGNGAPSSKASVDAVDTVSRQIRNVARIYNLGGSGNDNLILGKRTGNAAKTAATLTQNAVVVDADQEVLGKLVVSGDINTKGKVDAKGNVTSSNGHVQTLDGNLYAKDAAGGNGAANAGNVIADRDITAKGNLNGQQNANITGTTTTGAATVRGNASIAGTATMGAANVTGNATMGSAVVNGTARINGNTTFNGVTAHNGAANFNNAATFNGTTRVNNDLYAYRLVDANNTGFYVDPSNGSYLNVLETQSYVRPGQFTLNAGCGPNGALGRDNTGASMSCVNGVWKKGGGTNVGAWRSYGFRTYYTAPADGYLIVRSAHNSAIQIIVNGVERCWVSQRDKYGQGAVNCSTVLAKGEVFGVFDPNKNTAPQYIYYRPFS